MLVILVKLHRCKVLFVPSINSIRNSNQVEFSLVDPDSVLSVGAKCRVIDFCHFDETILPQNIPCIETK